jgi:hypothetical protein
MNCAEAGVEMKWGLALAKMQFIFYFKSYDSVRSDSYQGRIGIEKFEALEGSRIC